MYPHFIPRFVFGNLFVYELRRQVREISGNPTLTGGSGRTFEYLGFPQLVFDQYTNAYYTNNRCCTYTEQDWNKSRERIAKYVSWRWVLVALLSPKRGPFCYTLWDRDCTISQQCSASLLPPAILFRYDPQGYSAMRRG